MKVAIITFGCASNQADSDFMSSLLAEKEIPVLENPEDADIVIINSCTVKHHAEGKFWKCVREWQSAGKKIIAAGCVPQASEEAVKKLKNKGVSIIGVRDIDWVYDAVAAEIDSKHVIINSSGFKNPYKKPISLNGITGKLQINEGCVGFCSYCKTKFARGELLSYPVKDLVLQAECFLKQGAKELWLTSQDTGAYGLDIGESLITLANKITKLNGKFFLRIGMSNPNTIEPVLEEVLNLMRKDERVYRFLHIPIQSANDKVLKQMNRQYDKKMLASIFGKIEGSGLRITVSTDVICGFPGETEEQFNETLEFVKEIKPDVLNISRFWARPGTKAAKMKQHYNKIGIERARMLKKAFDQACKEKNKAWVGWKGKVLITEKGKGDTLISRNGHYKQIILEPGYKLGEFAEAEITRSRSFDFFGRALKRDV